MLYIFDFISLIKLYYKAKLEEDETLPLFLKVIANLQLLSCLAYKDRLEFHDSLKHTSSETNFVDVNFINLINLMSSLS